MHKFRNTYECPCGNTWQDDGDGTHDDKCAECNLAIQPSKSEDIDDGKDANGNENCLNELQCPACGNAGEKHAIYISAMAEFTLEDDGTDPASGPDWDDTAPMSCGCGYKGTHADWYAAYEKAHGNAEDEFKLCPYHQDGLGWDTCSEDYEGECEVEKAREAAHEEDADDGPASVFDPDLSGGP
jgi:hypothetical protein